MRKYLKHFPRPLLDDLVSGRWLPVVGAGMSLNASSPSGKKMPLWPQLGKALEQDLNGYESAGVLDTISAYEHEFGRARLIERLFEILLVRETKPGGAHRAFCSIPFDLVCTTNFDFLLERQYEANGRFVHPLIDEEQLSINGLPKGALVSPNHTLLFKLHGDLNHPSRLVVSEQDYDRFLTAYPLIATYLANQLISKTAVFVGYSLDDPDFRQLWSVVASRLGQTRRMAYAVMVGAKESDVTRFARRGVRVINLPGTNDEYGAILERAFAELEEHYRDNIISVSQILEEEPLRELSLPREARTRLCFFYVSPGLLPFYRSQVFPVVESVGFVPITIEDVQSPGDSVNAKLDAILDRSSVFVADVGENTSIPHLSRILGTAAHHREKLETILVVSSGMTTLWDVRTHRVVERESDVFTYGEDFTLQLRGILQEIASSLGLNQNSEAERLLRLQEGRAAVISAMALLEAQLRSQLDGAVRSYAPLRELVDQAALAKRISNEDRQKISDWMKVRNKLVHEGGSITISTAKRIVSEITKLLSKV